MPSGPLSLAAILSDVNQTTVSIGMRLAAELLVFLAVSGLLRALRARGVISRALGGLVKWLTALGLIWGLEHSLPPDVGDSAGRVFTIALLAAAWMAARYGVDFFYAKLFPSGIAGKPGRHILQDLSKFVILAMLAGWGLKELLNIQIGSLLTSSAILTAVIGLSMQDTIGSLFSGLLLQLEKPFQEGDWIRAGDVQGRVTEVTWRYTKVITPDDYEVLLPNNAVAKDRLVNYSRPGPTLRQTLHVPAPPDTPPVKIKSAILTALGRAEGVAKLPAPNVRLHEIQADRLIYTANYSIQAFDHRVAAADAVLSAVWYQFLERDIEIPAPTRRVYVNEPVERETSPERLASLAAVEMLSGMAEADMDMLARASVNRRFSAGQTIVATGETGTTMFIIISGQVAVLACGRELARLSPGQIFGEMALLTGEPRQADVRAVEPTRCLEVDREGFRMALARHPIIVERVRAIFTARAAANHSASPPDATAEAGTLFARFRNLFL
ncbi:MAG: cyclic nucleotide-binding domain-containing protein [Solidesulfovibrio sp.]